MGYPDVWVPDVPGISRPKTLCLGYFFGPDARGGLLRALAHQNRTIAIASDFRVDGAKSPEILQKEGVWCSAFAA